jgi:hypothetical protein
MDLVSACNDLIASVLDYCAIPLRQRPPFDVSRFEILDRNVYLEADRLGLSQHLPRPKYVNNRAVRGYTNLPVCERTMPELLGLFEPMPSQIGVWRSQMISLIELAQTRQGKTSDPAPGGNSEAHWLPGAIVPGYDPGACPEVKKLQRDFEQPVMRAKKRGRPEKSETKDSDRRFQDDFEVSGQRLKDFARDRGVSLKDAKAITARERTRRQRAKHRPET